MSTELGRRDRPPDRPPSPAGARGYDMWNPYLGVISRRVKNAVHVLDRFHIVAKKMNKAIDEMRAGSLGR